MSEQLDTIILPNDEETALIGFGSQSTLVTLADMAATAIADALDYLHTVGADPGALDDIHGEAYDLVQAVHQLGQALEGAVSMATVLREQRETVRVELAEFKHAVENADTSVPEVEEFWSIIEQANMEWLSYSMFDEWARLVDELIVTTPLSEGEAQDLVKVLGSEELRQDHTLWDTLRDWIADAQQVLDEEHAS